jgi:hypothetical protein
MKDLLRIVFRLAPSSASRRRPAEAAKQGLRLEPLEARALPSASLAGQVARPDSHVTPLASVATATYSPGQIRHAYGFDRLPYNGAGQTVAIVDGFDDPHALVDLRTFDRAFGLADPPLFVKATPQGAPPLNRTWAGEIALDVEWAHAIAPAARILLVEARSDTYTDLLAAVDYARRQPGVSAVSMSWGGTEFAGETAKDPIFTTPPGHGGVTFVASAGDNGAGTEWPAVSPNVLAVGGTTLRLTAQGAYGGEKAWAGGGGGRSWYEVRPAYQRPFQPYGQRTVPDVAYNADPNTGFYVYDSVPDAAGNVGWFSYGGTSAGAPQWAALVALADQGRAWAGRGALSGGPAALYAVSSADFHDITAAGNGFAAVAGYDLATGRGSPRADLVVADLVKSGVVPASQATTTTAPKNLSTSPAARRAPVQAAGVISGVTTEWTAAEWRLYLRTAGRDQPEGDLEGVFEA